MWFCGRGRPSYNAANGWKGIHWCCFEEVYQIKSLASLGNKLSINKRIPIDSSVLFGRLLIIAQRSTNMQQYFRYELTDLPSSLFKDGTMKKTDKSSLAKELLKSVKNSPNAAAVTNIVLDGGPPAAQSKVAIQCHIWWNSQSICIICFLTLWTKFCCSFWWLWKWTKYKRSWT